MKVTKGKYYYDIIPYPHIEVVHDGNTVRVTCDKYPECDSCNHRFYCYTEATEIVQLVKELET